MGTIKHKSFTLIELIVAVGVIGIILPSVFGIFFAMIRQQLVLIAYQTMKQQGDSAEINIKNIVQNRAVYISNSDYTKTTADICPLPPDPVPTYAPNLYIVDKDGRHINLSFNASQIASISANADGSNVNSYDLTTIPDVSVLLPTPVAPALPTVGFTCYRINEFTPAIVSVNFTILKSTVFKDTSLPYFFNVRLRNN